MSQQEQPAEEQQVVSGQVAGIITKKVDTWQVSVRDRPDSQYTKNLWTKDSELVSAMTQRIGREVTFYCRVSVWVRDDGQEVRSLWVDGWTDGGQPQGFQQIDPTQEMPTQQMPQQPQQWPMPQQPQAAFQPQPPMPQQAQQPQSQFVPQDVKEMRIMREAADKAAAEILGAMIRTGALPVDELTPAKLHGFMDAFSLRRITFYETGSSISDDEIPF